MTVTFQVERFSDTDPETVAEMIDAHWKEVGSFRRHFRRQINFSAYTNLEKMDRLLTVTAREDGVLIGYFIGALGNDLHRITISDPPKHVGVCSWLVYYIIPEKRGHARSFTRFAERAAAERGVQILHCRVKPGMNGADAFFKVLGYVVSEVTLTRLIGDAADAGSQPECD